MSKKQVAERGRKDSLKWGVVSLLWVLSFVAYYFFATVPVPLKAIGWIVILIVSAIILRTTIKGQIFSGFVKESRIELQKVVWPTRKEAGQITLIVILVVFLAGIFLWGIDSALIWGIGKVTQLKS